MYYVEWTIYRNFHISAKLTLTGLKRQKERLGNQLNNIVEAEYDTNYTSICKKFMGTE